MCLDVLNLFASYYILRLYTYVYNLCNPFPSFFSGLSPKVGLQQSYIVAGREPVSWQLVYYLPRLFQSRSPSTVPFPPLTPKIWFKLNFHAELHVALDLILVSSAGTAAFQLFVTPTLLPLNQWICPNSHHLLWHQNSNVPRLFVSVIPRPQHRAPHRCSYQSFADRSNWKWSVYSSG